MHNLQLEVAYLEGELYILIIRSLTVVIWRCFQNTVTVARFEVATAVFQQIQVFWDVTLCRVGLDPKNEGIAILRNVLNCLTIEDRTDRPSRKLGSQLSTNAMYHPKAPTTLREKPKSHKHSVIICYVFTWDIPLWRRYTDVRTAAVNQNCFIRFYTCNMFRLMHKETSSGWKGTTEKLLRKTFYIILRCPCIWLRSELTISIKIYKPKTLNFKFIYDKYK
jgi:hypothetical protein